MSLSCTAADHPVFKSLSLGLLKTGNPITSELPDFPKQY
jgi:hypothetical protein